MAADAFAGFESRLTPVVRVRSFDDVVAQLRAILLSGDIQPQEKLPSERELSRMLDVSRTTVREALRTLEANGLIEIRLGGTGGAFFRGPDAAMVGSALSMLLTFDSATERDLNEFRFSFEQENAALAAVRATREQRDDLRALADRAAAPKVDWPAMQKIDLAVHEALPVMTGNSVRIAISQGIHDALARTVDRVAQKTTPKSLRDELIGLIDLVVTGDAVGAREAMAAHLRRWRPEEASAVEAEAPGDKPDFLLR
jgi:GntR family transcriptional repressor for pyruvate dehydrogenase complex